MICKKYYNFTFTRINTIKEEKTCQVTFLRNIYMAEDQ